MSVIPAYRETVVTQPRVRVRTRTRYRAKVDVVGRVIALGLWMGAAFIASSLVGSAMLEVERQSTIQASTRLEQLQAREGVVSQEIMGLFGPGATRDWASRHGFTESVGRSGSSEESNRVAHIR